MNLLKDKFQNAFSKVQSAVKLDPYSNKQFQVNGQQISTTRQLAQGSFAYVYETSSPEYVIKHMNIQTRDQFKEALQEVHFQVQLNCHQNIAKVFALYVNLREVSLDSTFEDLKQTPTPLDFDIVMEKCDFSVLSALNALKPKQYLQEDQVLQLFAGAVAGFTCMANFHIINRDAKIENMLMKIPNKFTADNVRICDFGSCTSHYYEDPLQFIKNQSLRNQLDQDIQAKTTPQYRPPEMIDLLARLPITCQADVFSLGVMLYRLMYKVLPFGEGEILANFNCKYQFPDETDEFLKRGKYEEKPDIPIYSPFLKNLVRKCLVKKPQERITIFQLAEELQQKIGNFGFEKLAPKEVSQFEEEQVTPQQGLKPGVSIFEWSAVGGKLDFAPVQAQPAVQPGKSQPQNNQEMLGLEFAPKSNSLEFANCGLDFAPISEHVKTTFEKEVSGEDSLDKGPKHAPIVQQKSQGQFDLFGDTPKVQPIGLDFGVPVVKAAPVQPVQAISAQPLVQNQQNEDDMLDFSSSVTTTKESTQQDSKPTPKEPHPSAKPLDDMLDFSQPVSASPSQPVLQPVSQPTTQSQPPSQLQQSQSIQSQSLQTAKPQSVFENLLKSDNIEISPLQIPGDTIVAGVRKHACAIFTVLNLSETRLRERYLSMILLLHAALLNEVSSAQIQQLEQNFQMLVQQTQTSQNPNKEKIILVLKDLCTLQQMAATSSKLGPVEKWAELNNDQVPLVQKQLQLLNGFWGLSKNSPMSQKIAAQMTPFVKLVLKTAKQCCQFASQIEHSQQQQIKQTYVQLSQHKEVFGVKLAEVLELGEFE